MLNKEFKQALSISIPTFFAYFPLGIVFGVLFTHQDFPWFYAPIMSAVMYAGAVQFVAFGMMSEHASLVSIAFAALFISIRNSFYGLSVLDRFKPANPLLKFFLTFGLVDSAYAIFVTSDRKQNDLRFCFYVTLLLYLYWVSGTFLGAYFADLIPELKGMDFVLTSFFALIVIEYYLANKKLNAIIVPVIAACMAYIVLPQYYLLISIMLCAVYLYLNIRRQHHA